MSLSCARLHMFRLFGATFFISTNGYDDNNMRERPDNDNNNNDISKF